MRKFLSLALSAGPAGAAISRLRVFPPKPRPMPPDLGITLDSAQTDLTRTVPEGVAFAIQDSKAPACPVFRDGPGDLHPAQGRRYFSKSSFRSFTKVSAVFRSWR